MLESLLVYVFHELELWSGGVDFGHGTRRHLVDESAQELSIPEEVHQGFSLRKLFSCNFRDPSEALGLFGWVLSSGHLLKKDKYKMMIKRTKKLRNKK